MKKPAREYNFVLTLGGIAAITRAVEDALFEAGCDDATLGMTCGRVILDFSRAASSLQDALLSAIRDVHKAGIGATVLHIDEPTLVTQSDIARRAHRSRQQIHQYVSGRRGPGGFPAPVCHVKEKAPLWTWYDVNAWLARHNLVKDSETIREAEAVAAVNSLLELNHVAARNPKLVQQVVDTVGIPAGPRPRRTKRRERSGP
jgi:hypothetical protein